MTIDGDNKPRRGRPFGAINGHIGEAICTSSFDQAHKEALGRSSRTLLARMMTVGAEQGGCLSLSAAQCRARLRELAA